MPAYLRPREVSMSDVGIDFLLLLLLPLIFRTKVEI
jgi:hypothetical protein